jgi:hypothetical protein
VLGGVSLLWMTGSVRWRALRPTVEQPLPVATGAP